MTVSVLSFPSLSCPVYTAQEACDAGAEQEVLGKLDSRHRDEDSTSDSDSSSSEGASEPVTGKAVHADAADYGDDQHEETASARLPSDEGILHEQFSAMSTCTSGKKSATSLDNDNQPAGSNGNDGDAGAAHQSSDDDDDDDDEPIEDNTHVLQPGDARREDRCVVCLAFQVQGRGCRLRRSGVGASHDL